MGRYLQDMEVRYEAGDFLVGSETFDEHRLAEAMVCYLYSLQKGKGAANGTAKVILIRNPAAQKSTLLLDVLIHEHPCGFGSRRHEPSALIPLEQRYVGEVHRVLMTLATTLGWDTRALEAVKAAVVKANYAFNGIWVKKQRNVDRTRAVGVEWRTSDRIEVGFTYEIGRGGDTVWLPCATSAIGLGAMEWALGRFAWLDNRFARLWNRNKRDYWQLDTDTLEVEFHYQPADDGNPHGQYALAKMYLDGINLVGQDRAKGIRWLRVSAAQGFERAKRLLATLEGL